MSTADPAPSGISRRLAGLILVTALLAMSAGCSSASDQGDDSVSQEPADGQLPPAEKNDNGEERRDLEPLTTRFQAIGSPESAVWRGGTTGNNRIPGPSTYWIDAVITLDPETAERLRTDYGAQPTNDVPGVVERLVEYLPDGPLLTSDELNRVTGGGGLGGPAFIAVDSDQLVITKVGGPN